MIGQRLAFLLLFHIVNASQVAPPSISSSLLRDWIRARCGRTGHALWAYQGALYDPLDGRKIANVQGVELVRRLAEINEGDFLDKLRYRRRCGDLQSVEALSNPASIMDYASTILSRKLFCYTRVDEERPTLLRKIRLRPTSPQRPIPVDQAATVFDTATTYIERGFGSEWLMQTEWPDGRALWTRTNVKSNEEVVTAGIRRPTSIEFTAYARPQPRWRQGLPDLTQPFRHRRTDVTASPKRSAIIEFGSNADREAAKFGARETYQYSFDNYRCSVRYTRYGEAPVWYGPGRLCTLELTGRRVRDWNELPPLVARLATERVLGFRSVAARIGNDDQLASRAVESFRGRGAAKLQIAPEDDGMPAWVTNVARRTAALVGRVRSATSMSIGGVSSEQ